MAIFFDLGSINNKKEVILKDHVLCVCSYERQPTINIDKSLIESLEEESIQWALNFGLITKNEKYYEKFCRSKFANLTAHTVPALELKYYKMYILLAMFLFAFDDVLDNIQDVRSQSDEFNFDIIDKTVDVFIHIFQNKYRNLHDIPDVDFPLYIPLCKTLLEFQNLISQYPIDTTLFRERIAGYLRAVVWECIDHENSTRSEETYKFKRRHTIGFPFMFELVFAIQQIKLDESVRNGLMMKRYMEATCNILFLTNDVFSLKKEINAGEVENLVIMMENKLGLENAFHYVVHLLNSEILEIIRLGNLIKKLYQHDEQIIKYISIIEHYIDGHLFWYFDTKRYGDIQYRIEKVNCHGH